MDSLVAADNRRVVRANPLELFPDEFLAQVRTAVEQDGISLVVIDSLRGNQLDMDQVGSTLVHLHNLIHYHTRRGVTSILISEFENIACDLVTTESGVSHLADNIIL